MNTPDTINGLFEAFGAATGFVNVYYILRDKAVQGFSPSTYIFFTAWGCWNLYYYPHLGQWVSFAGSLAIAISNGLYAGLALYYARRQKWAQRAKQHAQQ